MRLLAALLAALLTLAPEARAQLAGVYDVGGATPDYATPAAAFADLEASGVSGPVLLRVHAGTYAGQLTLGPVAGASASSPVVVRGIPDAGTGALPVIEYGATSAADDWVLKLSGADHVTLEALRIQVPDPLTGLGHVVIADADFVEVRDCEIESVRWGQASGAATALRVTGTAPLIVGNEVTGGTRGIHVGGAATGQNARVRLNTVESDSVGIRVENQTDPGGAGVVVRANVVRGSIVSGAFVGIGVRDVGGAVEVSRNQVEASAAGIEVVDAAGTPAAPVQIVNNMAAATTGAAIRTEGSTEVGVVHNSTYAFISSAAGIQVASGSGVSIWNNVFHTYQGVSADIADPAAVAAIDDNVHSAEAGGFGFSARWGGVTHSTLAAWQAASGAAGSLALALDLVDPRTGDLHLAGTSDGDRDLRAPPLAGVSVDLDGDPRDATYPYYGADEGTESLDDPAPLSGIYTLRADGLGDYVSFDEALNDLVYGGVSGPVQFSVLVGTYTEQVTVPAIPGVSASAPVTFYGVPVGSNRPRLQHAPTPEANWVLRVESDHVSVVDLEVANTGSDPAAGRAVHVLGDDVTLERCEVYAFDAQSTPTALLSEAAAVFIEGAARARVVDGEIARAAVGVHASLGVATPGLSITGTAVSEPYARGLWVEGGKASVVEGNTIEQAAASGVAPGAVGIWLDGATGPYRVLGNEVTLYDADGVRVEGGTSAPGAEALVANNLVAAVATGGGSAVPLAIRGTDHVRALHNTLYTAGSGAALQIDGLGDASSGVAVLNTIGHGSGRAVEVETAAAVAEMDHNVWWGGAMPYAVGGTEYATLPAYRAGTGFGTDSDEAEPTYVQTPAVMGIGDLRLDPALGGNLRFAGTPLAEVPEDIDGAPRSATFPYAGAHELATAILPLAGSVTIDPGGGDYTTIAAFVADVNQRGVGAPLTATIAGGITYGGGFVLEDVPGLGPSTPLVIQGPDRGPRPLLKSASPLFVLDGVRNVTLQRLDGELTSATRAIELIGTTDVTIQDWNVVLRSGGVHVDAVVPTGEATNVRLTVQDNTFDGGGTGIAVGGSNWTVPDAWHLISGNVLQGQTAIAIDLGPVSGTVVANTISAPLSGSSWIGIDVSHAFVSPPAGIGLRLHIDRNQITGGEGTGIYWYATSSTPPEDASFRIGGNSVRMGGGGATLGISLSIPKNVLVAQNTVSLRGSDPAAKALYVNFSSGSTAFNGQSARAVNNILDGGGAIAMDVNYPTGALEESGWNVLHTTGPTLVEWWGTLCADVACYRAENPEDKYSVGGAVTFADAASGDLHLAGASVGDAAIAAPRLDGLHLDIDGQARPASGVYAGADEATSAPVARPKTEVPLVGTFTVDSAASSGGDFVSLYEASERANWARPRRRRHVRPRRRLAHPHGRHPHRRPRGRFPDGAPHRPVGPRR